MNKGSDVIEPSIVRGEAPGLNTILDTVELPKDMGEITTEIEETANLNNIEDTEEMPTVKIKTTNLKKIAKMVQLPKVSVET